MARLRELKRRIRSVENTRKITHAMELVAGAKMRRATDRVLGTRRYAELAWELLENVRHRADVRAHPLLAGRASPKPRAEAGRSPQGRSAFLVISGNRGLVGAFNERITGHARSLITREVTAPLVVTAGKVARDKLARRGVAIEADFPKKDLVQSPEDASPIVRVLLSSFLAGTVDRVVMVYADFRSVLRQEVRARVLLPVGQPDPALGDVGDGVAVAAVGSSSPSEYLFEPSPEEVLEAVVPNLLAVQVYQALTETTASEHAARMVAMRSATENADEIHDDLLLAFNDARKSSITQEILEIVAGTRAVTQ